MSPRRIKWNEVRMERPESEGRGSCSEALGHWPASVLNLRSNSRSIGIRLHAHLLNQAANSSDRN